MEMGPPCPSPPLALSSAALSLLSFAAFRFACISQNGRALARRGRAGGGAGGSDGRVGSEVELLEARGPTRCELWILSNEMTSLLGGALAWPSSASASAAAAAAAGDAEEGDAEELDCL